MNKKIIIFLFRYILSFLSVFIIGMGFFMWWAVGTNPPKKTELGVTPNENSLVQDTPPEIIVATYNIGHGHGLKEKPWHSRDKRTTENQMQQIAAAIGEINADLVLLQEVDIDSQRTHHINEIELIKNKTGYQYSVCAILWEKNYIPFPYWPPSGHIGSVKAANCVLSRFPITKHERLIFDKPKSNPFWYNWGYLDYGLQRVDIELGAKKLAVLNVHLESWDRNTRREQIEEIHEFINEITHPVIFGGDFNTIPDDALKKSGFLDEPETDYSDDSTLRWFFKNQKNLSVAQLSANIESPHENYTFPSDHPDRRLDHIFLIGQSLSFTSYHIFAEAKTASDHLPVKAKIKIE